MLTLSRKQGESVQLTTSAGEVIIIHVDLSDHGHGLGRVRLSFDAPPGVRIWRTELLPVTERDRVAACDGEGA